MGASEDERRELRHRPPRKPAGRDPEIPAGVNAGALDRSVRAELATLGRDLASETGAHLAAVSHFFEDDPERAWGHAMAARRRAGRFAIVRETAGLAAYNAGHYDDALTELRTARRISGSNANLPVMADAERGLGRPERALELAHSDEAKTLGYDARIELLIVESGARADLGEYEAAVVVLQTPDLDSTKKSAALARLRFAYSEALGRAAREREADTWRARALASDPDGSAGLVDPDDEEDLEIYDLEDAEGSDEAEAGEDVPVADEGVDGQVAELDVDAELDDLDDAEESEAELDAAEEDLDLYDDAPVGETVGGAGDQAEAGPEERG